MSRVTRPVLYLLRQAPSQSLLETIAVAALYRILLKTDTDGYAKLYGSCRDNCLFSKSREGGTGVGTRNN